MELRSFTLLVLYVCFREVICLDTYHINEERSKGYIIGNIPEDLPLSPLSSNSEPREYKILNKLDTIEVDSVSGDLRTKKPLDREGLCRNNPRECIIDVEVGILPEQYFQLIKIQVIIDDLNDNTPKFPSDVIEKDISESAFVGSVIRLDSAIDPDLGTNSIQRYEISSSPATSEENGMSVPYFQLDVIDVAGRTKIPQLRLSERLDREKVQSYTMLLYAVDGGSPALTGTATVVISVTDSNDNPPFFSESTYRVEVNEDVMPGYEVITLTATDLDEGPNARIMYSFPSIVGDHERATFNLNPTTGVISVSDLGLDYENRSIHPLTVEAKDSGPNPASAYVTVTVIVKDVNDEAPTIDVNFMDVAVKQSEGTTSDGRHETLLIKENLKVGTLLAFVTITDRDTGMNGNVSCRLKESESFEMKSLDANENRYLIKTKGELDREERRLHNIEIEAWDLGHPTLSSSKTIIVELEDENDNGPTFGKNLYQLSVKENAQRGKVIANIKAEDPDDGENARITYIAKPEQTGAYVPFGIDSKSGGVFFREDGPALDAENRTDPFYLLVTAYDNGNPRRNTTTRVEIYIADVNDNMPRFKERSYVFHVEEDAKHGQYVGSVTANDADIDKLTNGKVTYSFLEESKAFSINPDTGEIHFRGKPVDLDRESRQSQPYVLTVIATDHGSSPRTERCYVEIYLIDVNDNKPIITFPDARQDIVFLYIKPKRKTSSAATRVKQRKHSKRSIENREFLGSKKSSNRSANPIPSFTVKNVQKSSLRRALLIGSTKSSKTWRPTSSPVVITQIVADDPDAGENGRVRYTLAKGNIHDYFAVDMQSGNVTLTFNDVESLRSMKRGCQVIEIHVNDLGKPSQQSKTWVNIYITDKIPANINSSEAMKSCMNNTFYPVTLLPPADNGVGGLSMSMVYIIAGASLIVLIIILIVVIVRCRKRCCSSKSRSYKCKDEVDAYHDPNHAHGSPTGSRKNKDSHQHIPNGTIDSRTSFYTEWTASQIRVAQEKGDMTMHAEMPDGSVGSRNSAKDSGTGDSMPSDAYHMTLIGGQGVYSRQAYPNQPYQRPTQAYISPQYQPSHVYLPPQDDLIATDEESRHGSRPFLTNNQMVYGSKCTNECRMYGHSDTCWMPDNQQRSSSRMATSYKSTDEFDGDSLKYQKRAMTPNSYHRHMESMRYVNAPSNTPYYYDPGSKFDNVQSRGKFPSFREDNLVSDRGSPAHSQVASSNASRQPSANYRQPGYASHGQLAQPAYAQSPVPFNTVPTASHGGQPRGKAYVNLQGAGYDPNTGLLEEAHSNLSSTSSGNQQPNYQSQHAYPQQYYQPEQSSFPSHQYPSTVYHGYEQPHEYGIEPGYDDNFAATNLLLSPADSDGAEYKQRLERQMKQHQQQQKPTYNYGNHTEVESRRLLTEHGNMEHGDDGASTDKLSTIREEIDADEVVAEIDGLLL